MPTFNNLDAYLVRDDMTRVPEYGPAAGERLKNEGGLYDGYSGQSVVYVEMTGRERYHIVVKCLEKFKFGQWPELEVQYLTTDGRSYLGYITQSSEDQSVCLRGLDYQPLEEPTFMKETRKHMLPIYVRK